VYFTYTLCRAYNIEGIEKDKIIAAAIFHDIVKYAQPMQKHTTKTHDADGANFVYSLGKLYESEGNTIDQATVKSICKTMSHHMGRWQVGDKAKRFPEEFTTPEIILHLSDMCSASKEVNLEFLQQNLIG
jgi:HD superfamily phosphodiesterase